MYTALSDKFTHLTWEYLGISDSLLNSRYDWVTIAAPVENQQFPWAHEYDMIRLFLLCRTFRSETEAFRWIKQNLDTHMSARHQELVTFFCYPETEVSGSFDTYIEQTENIHLLWFIYAVLDRSLLWNNPDPCWKSDFMTILSVASKQLSQTENTVLKVVERQEVEGVYMVSGAPYTHVFYKFQNAVAGIKKGELYYNLRDLAKQAHEALVQSMLLNFSVKTTILDEISWERKMSEITALETNWCKDRLRRIIHG